jgi:hypothetical protein
MTVTGSCHRGAVTIEVSGAPEWLARCNCSVCRRTGSLIAYYPDDGGVRVKGETVAYIWGDRLLDGYAERDGKSLFEGREIEVRHMDNA